MNTSKANIRVSRNKGKLKSISVLMPVWNKPSASGHVQVHLPLLHIDTVAKDDKDAKKAIEESLVSFCVASEQFGQGVEKELQALGWIEMDSETGEPVLGFNVSDPDAVINKILQTGENYINAHLAIA